MNRLTDQQAEELRLKASGRAFPTYSINVLNTELLSLLESRAEANRLADELVSLQANFVQLTQECGKANLEAARLAAENAVKMHWVDEVEHHREIIRKLLPLAKRAYAERGGNRYFEIEDTIAAAEATNRR